MRQQFYLPFLVLLAHAACSTGQADTPVTPSPVPAENPNTTTAPVTPSPPTTTPAADPNHPASGPTVRLLGRFDSSDPNRGAVFAWPASAMITRVLGTGITINLADSGTNTYQGVAVNNWYDVYVDGVRGTPFQTTATAAQYTVAQNLPQGDHIIRVSKRTEPQMGTAIFNGFTPLAGGTLLPAPLALDRRIEFIGDSITAGYGADGNQATATGCPFTAQTENADATFASMTASSLNADFFAIAFSGKGIYQNDDCYGDSYYTLPTLYSSIVPLVTNSNWDFTSWVPQVVVVNLGTNDYNMDNGCSAPNSSSFTSAWVSFIKVIRGNYPDAGIFCTVGPELHAPNLAIAQANIQSAVSSLTTAGDSKLFYIALPEDTGANGYGCAGHPNFATHAIMANTVTAAIRSKMSW